METFWKNIYENTEKGYKFFSRRKGMKDQRNVKSLYNTFFSNNYSLRDVMDIYVKNSGKYDKEDYLELRYLLYPQAELFVKDTYQYHIWTAFDALMHVCSKEIENTEKRKELIKVINEFLMYVKDKVSRKYRNGVEIRNAALNFLLNIVCTFSEDRYKIQYSAMIFDMVDRYNIDESFYEFYGEGAKEYILVCVLDILKRSNISDRYVKDILIEENDKKYVDNFCRLILKSGDQNQRKVEEKHMETGDKSSNAFKVAWGCIIFICIIILLLFGTFAYEKNSIHEILKEDRKEISDLKRKIDSLESELAKQLDEIKSVKADQDKKNQQMEQAIEEEKQEIDNNGENPDGESPPAAENKNYKMPFKSNVWAEKSEKSYVLGEIEAGEEVNILSERDNEGWIEILYQEQTGYIKAPTQEPDNS